MEKTVRQDNHNRQAIHYNYNNNIFLITVNNNNNNGNHNNNNGNGKEYDGNSLPWNQQRATKNQAALLVGSKEAVNSNSKQKKNLACHRHELAAIIPTLSDGEGGYSNEEDLSKILDNIYSKRATKLWEQEPDFIHDPLDDFICAGCRTTKLIYKGRPTTCGAAIMDVMGDNNTGDGILLDQTKKFVLAFAQAAYVLVEKQKRTKCRVCLASYCAHKMSNSNATQSASSWHRQAQIPDERTKEKYWRVDRVAPQIHRATSHVLASIPPEYRVPLPSSIMTTKEESAHASAQPLENQLNHYFDQPQHSFPQRRYFFEYNPTILALPKDMIAAWTTTIPSQNHRKDCDDMDDDDRPAYIASYRVSTSQSCFPTNITLRLLGNSWSHRKPNQVDYLGIALLNNNLEVLVDTVVDPPLDKFGPREDFRLFWLRDKIYLSSFCHLVPLHLQWTHNDKEKETLQEQFTANNTNKNDDGWYVAPRAFNTTTAPSSSSSLVILLGHNQTTCTHKDRERFLAKNIRYFVNPQTNQIVSESQVMDPRLLHTIRLEGVPDPKDDVLDQGGDTPLIPSFASRIEVDMVQHYNYWGSPLSGDRGSACCVSIDVHRDWLAGGRTQPRPRKEHSRHDETLLLGISHVITHNHKPELVGKVAPHQYLSRFYAFDTTTPYTLRALSGYFCLPANPGQRSMTKRNSGHHPDYSDLPLDTWKPLSIVNTTYDCPAIHFVSGMTEKVDDPDTLIIAYGVNDCTSWFVEVKKSDVVDLLFSGPQNFAAANS